MPKHGSALGHHLRIHVRSHALTAPSPPGQVAHPNVVNLFEVIDDPEGSELFMILEYVECGSVKARVDDILPEALCRSFFRDVCKGLDYLHFNKVRGLGTGIRLHPQGGCTAGRAPAG